MEKIEYFKNRRGFPNPDQAHSITETPEGSVHVFRSYGRVLAVVEVKRKGLTRTTLDARYWNYSTTSTRYLIKFLNKVLGLVASSNALDARSLRQALKKKVFHLAVLGEMK